MAQDNESTKWLYKQLSQRGYNVGNDEAEFDELMRTNASSRKWAYNTAKASGLDVGEDQAEFDRLVSPGQQGSTPGRQESRQQSTAVGQAGSAAQQVVDEYDESVRKNQNAKEATPITDKDRSNMMGYARLIENKAGGVVNRGLEQIGISESRASSPLRVRRNNIGIGSEPIHVGESPNVVKTKDGKYATETGNVYDSRNLADYEQNQIDDIRRRELDPINTGLKDAYNEKAFLEARLTQRRRELDAKEKEQNKGIGGLLRSFAEASRIRGGAIDTDPDSKYQATDRDYMNISAALRENEKRIRSLEALRDKTSLGVAGTIGRALGNTLGTFGAWDFGRSDMQDATAMTFSRIGRGGYYEQEYLKNKVLADEAAAQEDKEMGDLYRWAKIGGTSVSWAKDFLLFNNPMRGITRLSTRAGLKTAERLALNGWKKAAMKNLGILAGDVAGSAALATTLQGRTTVKDITDRYSGEIGIADNGNLYFKGGDSFSDAVRRGVTSATIENYTERLGEHLPSLAPLVKKGLARIGLSGMNRWIERAGASSAYKTMHDWLARSGFNGFGGEVAEEEINIALNALLVGDQSFSDYLDPKTHLDIVGGMALSMGMMGGGALASYGVQQGVNAWEYNRIRKRLSDADRVASYRFGQERWAPLKDAIDNTPNDGMADMMNGISSDSNMPVQEKQAAFQYIIRLLNMRGHNLKETAQSEENGNAEARPAETKIIHDDNGYTVVSVDDSGNQISSETFNNREDAETRIAEMGMRRKSDDVKSIYAIAMRLSPESGAAAIISQIEEDHGLESGALGKLVDKDPLKVTDEEQAILDDAYSRLKSLAYPNGELHTEQSMQEGVTMADEHEIAEDNDISEINGELDNARQAMENVFAANEPLHEDFMRLRQYGEAEVVDYLARNYRPEEVAAVCDYLNAKARRDGYVARTGGKIEEAVANETRKRTFSGNLNGEMHEHDQIIVVTDGQQEYRLASGDVMTDTQGRINPDASGSDIVVVCDSDGNLIPMKASAQLSVVRTENPDDFAKALTEQLQVDATAKIGIEQPLQGEAQADKETAAEEQAVQEDIATDAIPQVKPEEQQAQASGQQASRIPVDEQGAPQYHLAPIEDTIADLYDGQLSDDEIRQFVDANISDAEKAYQEIQKDAPKMSTDKGKYVADKAAWQAQVDEARQKAGYWQDVRKNIENMTHTTPDELEAARRELTGETPREEYLSQLSGEAQPSTATGLASMFIYDAKITPESFRKETGYTTTEQKRFVGMIASKQNGGKTIKELAEGLVSYDNTYTNGVFFHGDSNEARNAIIDALQSARSRAGLKDNMTDSYRDYVEQREQAREDYYQEAYHMSYEDYLEYSEREMPDLLRKYSNFDEQEFLNLYGEEIEQSINARRNEQGNDTAGEEPRTDSGTEVLHREGAGDERGTGRGQESASEVPPQRDGGNEEGAVRESTRQGNVEGDTVGGSPVALSYLLENGKGTIESSGYFLHGVAAAFPEITGQIEEIRGRYLDEINPSPIEYANSGHRSITEIRNLVDSVYGERGVSIFDKLLQNADGFVPRDGAAVAREIEELRPIGDGNKNGNISEEIDRTTIDPRSMSDSERQRRGDMLRNAPAIEVEAEQIVSTPELSARKVAERWWDENVPEPVFYDTEVGEVEINKNSVESSLAHRYGQAKLDAITSLVEGFENAVYLGTLPDFTRQEGVSSHYFAYPIIYKGKRCYVFCRAMQDANKNRLYVHEVFVAENIKKGDTLQTAASQPHGGIALYKDILVNVLEDKFSSSERRLTEPQGEGSDLVPSPNLVSSESKDSESPANGQTIGEKIAEEEAKVETSPSDAQKEAGNYKKGHVNIDGYDITIETPKGSVRSGIDAEGQPWSVTMNNTYGYIRGTEGVDGDHIDVFLSDDPTQGDVYVIDQVNEDGSFDEHKVMYGFKSALAAKRAYLANYSPGWQGLGTITKVSKDEFRKWVDSSHRKTKPFSEYKSVKEDGAQNERNEPLESVSNVRYEITPSTYTNKKGRTTDVSLLTFNDGLTTEQERAVNGFAKEKLGDGRFAKTRGWKDRNSGGWMFRNEEDARKAAEMVNDEEAVSNAQPVSLSDIREVEPEKHDWKYRVSVDNNTGRTMITRSETTNGVPVDDANFGLTADSPQDMLDILGNPQNGMNEVLNAVRTDLENAVMTQTMDRSETNEASQPRQVDIEGVFNDLNRNGEARLSDHFVIGRPGLTERMGNEQTANGEKQQTDEGYGANNKVVSRDRYEELKKRMRNKIYGQLNVGIDPEILAIGTEMAVYHIEAGARKFADYARHMIDDLGDAIRPYLKTFYNGVRDMPEAEEAGLVADMTPYEEVRAFDTANFGKDVVNPMDTAATIRDEIRNEREAEGAKSEIIQQRNKKDAQRKRTDEKKSVSSQAEQGDLFANVNEQQNQEDNERVQGLQQRTAGERTKRHTGDTPRQVGESQRSEAEQPAGERVGTDSGTNVRDDRERSSRVAGLHEGEGGRVARNRNNNHAERGLDYAPTTPKARYDANVAAIRLAKELTDSGQQATSEQKAVLRQFSGWGGLGTFFNNERTRRELVELLGDDGYQQAAMSINSAYYTPASVVDTMWDIVKNLGFKGGNILEGSAGIGNILGLMPMDISDRSNIEAVEIDGLSGMILKLLYPDADVKIQGFENTQVRNGSVDLAITNVPFVTGLRVHDTTGDRDLSRRFGNIHDFCIAKNIRKLREGGIGVFISSNGTLDKSKGLRDWVTSEGNADFIGAFRLNNKTFGGTTATSDIIVVRKRVNGNKSAGAIDVLDTESVRTVDVPTGEYKTARGSYEEVKKPTVLQYNKYFVEHPEYMGGEMALNYEHGETFRPESSGLFPTSMIDQNARLRQWTETFKDKAVYTPQAQAEEAVAAQPGAEEGRIKDGTIVVGNDGNINVMYLGRQEPLNVNSNKVKGHTKAECVEDYNRLKKALAALLDYESTTEGNDGLQPLLKELNDAYDNFKGKYGNLNKNTAISFLRNDIDFPSVQALEKYTETNDKDGKRIAQTEKTAIFNERVVQKEVEPHPTNIVDAVKASVFKTGRIDIPYISEQLGMSNNEVKDSIVKGGYGFVDPATQEMEVSYEYLSGNVREKLAIAEANNEDGRYDNNIKALRKVVPMDIPAHLIEFTFGSSWVNPKLFSDYVSEKTGVDVKLTNVGGRWNMEMPYYIATEKNKAEGVRSRKLNKLIYGTDLMNAAINNQTITVSSTQKTWDGKTETVTDKEATQACAAKIDDIRNDFKDWARARMQSDPDMAREMERVYNDRFNNYVPVQVTDEFVRTQFPGASKKINLFPHQAKAAIRATGQPIMLAHEVGTGKTFTLITIAMEMRRLGLARKPMIVVQNATVGQFVESAKELYPNAKVLTIADNERNEEGRKKFYAKIKYNDWDMIVVPQSVFERIPDSEERQMAFINSRIEERQHVLEQMQKIDAKSIIARNAKRELDGLRAELVEVSDKKRQRDEKRAAKTRQNAAAKAQEQLDRVTDDVENFDDMEIDAVLVDEAHEYKHLGFSTAMQRGVKGVDPSYSKKSAGVYLKTRAVMDKSGGKNVVFATGTPISNTAAEIWTFMRYLMPEHTMREYGIYYFDDFVRNFGNLTQMLEFTTGGKFKENNRFAGYVNIPELMRIWSGVADTVLTSETDLKDKLPETVEGGQKATDIYLPQSASLRSIMKAVRTELERFDKMSGKKKKENSAIPLVMYGIAKAAAIDPRLVMADAADEPMSKTNRAVEETLKSLEATKGYKGTVAIFCDTYQNNQTGFNIYDEIKRKLVERGVPEKEIVIMRSGMSVNKKAEIFDKVNAGDVRVIMGSTFTLGTGVNIQERLNTLIHLDAPNRPMDYTQRNGRILRQGNLHKQWGLPVKILRFGVEDSLDITAYQRLKTKGAIADSVMEGKKFLNNNQQDRTLEEQEDVFGDTVAQLSGSEYALLKNQAERDYRKYSNKKKQYEADQIYVHNAIPRYEGQIKRSEDTIKQQRKALADVEKAFPGGNVQEISIGNSKLSGPKAIGDHIKDVVNKKQTETEDKVRGGLEGTKASTSFTVKAGPFTFTIRTEYSKDSEFQNGTLFPVVHRNMTYSCEQLGLEDVPVQRASFKNAIDDIMDNVLSGNDMRERIETETNLLERNRSDLEQLKSREGKPFENENELEEARKKVEDYTKKMKEEMEAKEKKYAEIDSQTKSADIDKLSGAEEAEEEGEVRYRFIGEQGAARLDAAEEATTRLDNLDTARQMEQAYNDKKARIEKLRNSKPVELTGNEYKGKYELTRKSAQEFLLNDLRGEYTIADTGEKVNLSKVGAKKVTSHSMGNEAHLKFIVAIPQLLENAIFIEERANEKDNDKYDSYRYYVVGLKIGNEDYTARLTVGVKKGKYYYDHYLTEIEKGNLIEIANGFTPTEGAPIPSYTESKDSRLISLLQTNDRENARKIREATGWERGADGEWHYIGGGRYRTSGEAARQADARIKEHIDKIGRKLNTPITVHESADSIQNPQVRRAIENGQRVAGWWDSRDNSVHLYLPNINSRYDAERTIAHEVIGHKGLRELLGNDGYRKFMRDLWTRGDEELVSYVRAHLQGNGWDLYRTIDEYLAEKAEERVPAQGFWQRVRQFLVRQLRNIGFALRPNLNDVRYMLWLSENRMRRGNPMSEMRRNAFLYNVSKNTYTPETYADRIFKTDTEADEGMDVDNQTVLPKDVRFRISSEDRDQSDTPMAMLDKEQYEQAVTSSAFKWREAYVDYMSAFKELQDILSGGNEIPDSMNAYDAENHASSVIQEKEARFFNKEWKKFDESIKACLQDIDKSPRKALEELEMYAYKKHGLERNRVLYIRDAANRFNNEREGSGDLLIEQFHALRNELDKQLGSSEISLSQYYSTIDSFIQDKINPDYRADMNDKSGISNLTEKRDDGSFDEQAVIDSVESMEDMLGKERISDLWDAIGGVTGYSLRNDYESGIISKDSYDKVNGMFNWYIPLRGFKEDTAEDVYNYMLSEGGGGTGPTLKHAGGRTSLAESPFATMGSMASRSISNGERNKVKQRFFRLVNDYLSRVDDKTRSIVSLSSVWEVMDGTNPDGSERWTIAYPEGTDGKSADEVARIVTDFNNRMVEKAKNHEARRVKSRGGIPYRFENERNKNEHIVQVSVNGNSQLIIINGNPRAAQALNGLLNPSSSNDALKIWGRWNRWMSSMFTTMNPTFVLSNTMRDAVFSRTNIATKENASYLRQYLKNYDTLIYRELISGKLWEKYRDGKIDMNNDTERYFKEFMDNGGKTGYVELKNVEKYKKILERGVSPSRARQAWETVRTPFSLIEDVNERAENLSRFATYVTSRQMGRSVLRSISDAKDVSVNFNRKGAGAKTGGLIGYSAELMRHAYLFFNAGMQSLALLCRNIKNYPLKFAAIQFGKFFTAGAMMPIVNMMLEAMLGGDDDDGVSEYANLPEWTRRNNLCFYAGNGNFIKIPLPIELRAFYGLGDIAAGYVFDSNLRSLKSPVADIAGQLSQIAPIDFMGEGGSFTSAMMPDAIKPIWQNVINRDWTGKPIQKEDTPWNRYDPEWTKAFKSENTVAVEICKAINTMSGGDEVKKGHIDLSPAQMMNLVSGYFGGAGTTVIEAFDLGKRIVTWDFDGLNTRNIPLLKAVTSQSDDRTKFFRTRAKYYNYLDEAQKTERYISNYMKNSSNPTLIMKGISLQTSSAGLRSRIIGEYNKEIGELNKIVNAPIDDKEKEAAQSMIYRLQEQAVMKLDKVAE